MDLVKQIEQDFNQAFREKNDLAVLTLRQVKAALHNAEIANNRKALVAQDVVKVLKSEVKKRREAAELYQKGGRAELAEKEQQEIEIISKYLPEEMDEGAVRKAVVAAISGVGAKGPADMGKVMAAAMQQLKGQADGSVVSRIVKEELASIS